MIKAPNRTQLSQTYFNPVSLYFYDFILYQLISPYFWGCSSKFLIDRYRHFISRNHLEVGVGTAYLLDKLNPIGNKIDLMDLNENCLNKSKKRLARYIPKTIQHNILEPYLQYGSKYDSISINYVMHCVSGDFTSKSIAFRNLKTLLKKDGVLFGTTIINSDTSNYCAKVLIKTLNLLGIFNNTNDRIEDLKQGLNKYFKFTHVQIRSTTAIFFASDNPITDKKVRNWQNEYE